MKYFVLWSGGADSTYLINELLKQGHYVSANYISLENNEAKIKREIKATDIMSKWFYDKYGNNFEYNKETLSVDINGHVSQHALIGLYQAPIWVLGAIYFSLGYDKVALGYIMNDDAISYLEDFKNIFYSFKGLTIYKFPELVFPLSKISKSEIINSLPKSLFENITWCESGEKDLCGECIPCLKIKHYEELGLINDDRWTFKKKTKPKQKKPSLIKKVKIENA